MYEKVSNLKNYTTRIGGEQLSNNAGFLLTEYENTDTAVVTVKHIENGEAKGTGTWTGYPNTYMHFKLELKDTQVTKTAAYAYIEFTEIMGEPSSDGKRPYQRRCKVFGTHPNDYVDYGAETNEPKGCQLYWTYLKPSSDLKTIEGYIGWANWISKCSWYVQLFDSSDNLIADTSFFDNRPPTIVRSGLKFDYEGTPSAYEGITYGDSRVGFGSIQSNPNDDKTKFQGYYSIDNTNFGSDAVKKEINSVSSVVILNGGKTTNDAAGVRPQQHEPIYYVDISAIIPNALYTDGYRFNTNSNSVSSCYFEGGKTHLLDYNPFPANYSDVEIHCANKDNKGTFKVITTKQYIKSNDFENEGFSSTNLGTSLFAMRLNTMNYE